MAFSVFLTWQISNDAKNNGNLDSRLGRFPLPFLSCASLITCKRSNPFGCPPGETNRFSGMIEQGPRGGLLPILFYRSRKHLDTPSLLPIPSLRASSKPF